MKMHVSVNIRGILEQSDKKIRGILIDTKTGKELTAFDVRNDLNAMLANGQEYLPMHECNNFDPKKGCLGHN